MARKKHKGIFEGWLAPSNGGWAWKIGTPHFTLYWEHPSLNKKECLEDAEKICGFTNIKIVKKLWDDWGKRPPTKSGGISDNFDAEVEKIKQEAQDPNAHTLSAPLAFFDGEKQI